MKWKSKLYSLYSVALAFVLLLSPMSSIGSLANTTSGSEIEGPFEYTEQYVKKNFNAICRYVVKWNAIISDSVIGSWNNFTSWLDSSGNSDIWEQHPHSPIRNTGEVEVPEEVLEVLNQYIIYQIQATPLSYTECYINSYNFLSPELFPNYQMYSSTKEYIRQQDGYSLLYPYRAGGTFQYVIATYYNRSDFNFVGTTTAGGFTNVHGYIGWSEMTANNIISTADDVVKVNTNGSIDDLNSLSGISTTNIYNTAMGSTANNGTYNKFYAFSNYDKNELVYVFASLNALKNYNAGMPQPYYLTSEGLANNMSNWTVGSGTINTGTLSNANSSYSNVVNNIKSGWTAQEVLALVDRISSSDSGSGSGSGDGSDGWLDLGIFGDIGKAIAKVIGAIITAIASIFEEIIGIVTQVSDTLLQGVIFEFLSAFIGWLPEEIIALLTALFSVAVLFALVKLIREAF